MKYSGMTVIAAVSLFGFSMYSEAVAKATVEVDYDHGKAISPLLMGVFYEDLSYAADGGLYAELIENRSFDYSAAEGRGWNALSFWNLETRGGGDGQMISDSADPIHPNNPLYLVLGIRNPGEGVGVINHGYGGIPLKAGEAYDFSVFARQLSSPASPLTVLLETKDGSEVLAQAEFPAITSSWKKYTAELSPNKTVDDARLVLLAHGKGRIGIDMVSLFPRNTFNNRPNGLRAGLAQAIADIKPRFMRFPGGCLVHGDGIDNMYNWKNSIGPVEQRKGQRNIWRYHQSLGLGYFEYFQFCEDIGAEPLPVVPAGVSCQNSGASVSGAWGQGQQCVAMADMPAFIQDILDLIEWANGPADSEWGAKRAAAGHPEPFGLNYLGVGNEDAITPGFEERFEMIYKVLKEKHPEITIVGTVGPAPDDDDYRKGWDVARRLKVDMVDEHCYRSPQWFWDNLNRWDAYDRDASKVYLGEWAAHDQGKKSTLRAAIAEAAYWTAMERNGDVVSMASYAPLLARNGNTHWTPDLIFFSNTEVFPTISYQVQKLLGNNGGDIYLSTACSDVEGRFSASTVRDRSSGDTIIKLVNGESDFRSVQVKLNGQIGILPPALKTVLSGANPDAVNSGRGAAAGDIVPVSEKIRVASSFDVRLEPNSLTIIRISGK
ncbi:MAG: carbohydrate binding domain-containing protein [Pontiellaceae bacterium]|nr:carbohydrate binding domain-containing protein [Pontiellaceae bacterium]MBN2784483.1 carbohydrate binding domain-containing protein [Pontiellaceae bacterium]